MTAEVRSGCQPRSRSLEFSAGRGGEEIANPDELCVQSVCDCRVEVEEIRGREN